MLRSSLLSTVALISTLPLATAQTPAPAPVPAPVQKITLSVGDKAPPLTIEKWVKGTPVTAFEKGKVYMIECWATWCGPCKAAMPHVTELQKKYASKGFTVIGLTTVDSRPPAPNTLDAVQEMVAAKEKSGEIGYSIAWDKDTTTKEAWMKAAGKAGIPCSFLVDGNGQIAYIGHPMQIDDTLALVIDGKHDIAKLAAEYKASQEMTTRSIGQPTTPTPAAAPVPALKVELGTAFQHKDWAKVGEKADLALADIATYPEAPGMKFLSLALGTKDMDKAYAFAKSTFEAPMKDVPVKEAALALNDVAWFIVDPDYKLAPKDLDLALKIAQRAVDLTESKNGAILDTLARVYFTKGDVEKALELQEKAVITEPRAKPALEEYKAALAKKKAGG